LFPQSHPDAIAMKIKALTVNSLDIGLGFM